MRIFNTSLIVVLLVLFALPLQAQNMTLGNIEELLKSSEWTKRNYAANNILSVPFEDTTKVFHLILEGIKLEITDPSSDKIQTSVMST